MCSNKKLPVERNPKNGQRKSICDFSIMYGEYLSKVFYVRNFIVAKKVSKHPSVSISFN